jgi:hypothetical protein
VWFPLDQPLAFDNGGAGVDPMAVTERGSLWLYALTWPLTAVNMAARTGDMPLLRRELEALGVAAAVDRRKMHSRFYSYAVQGDIAARLFARPLVFDATLGDRRPAGPGVNVYRIPGPLPAGYLTDRYAVVPQRLRAIAAIASLRAAPFAFAQQLPERFPYDAYYDSADAPWEALQVAGLAQPLPTPGVDAHGSFAGGDVWWWWRPAYADNPAFALAFGRAQRSLRPRVALREATLVVAWIASPAGGRLEVGCGRVQRVLDTGAGWGEWRSAALGCGPLGIEDRVTARARDPGAEVALRGLQLVERGAFERARGRLAAVLGGADHDIPLDREPFRPAPARTGRSEHIALVGSGVRAVLEVERADAGRSSASARVLAPDGFLVAWRPFAPGAKRLAIPLSGEGSALQVRLLGARLAGWRLLIAAPATTPSPLARAQRATQGRLFVFGQGFDPGWRVDDALSDLPSAIGTNVFVLPRTPAADPVARFAYTSRYHVAFALGTLTLAVGLAAGVALAGRRKPARGTVREPAERTAT